MGSLDQWQEAQLEEWGKKEAARCDSGDPGAPAGRAEAGGSRLARLSARLPGHALVVTTTQCSMSTPIMPRVCPSKLLILAPLADLEFCELPGIINTPPAERSAAEEAWSRGRCRAAGMEGSSLWRHSCALSCQHASSGKKLPGCHACLVPAVAPAHHPPALASLSAPHGPLLDMRRWLLGLLVLQSMSSVVLDSYQELLRDHLVVTLFLTMLVRGWQK